MMSRILEELSHRCLLYYMSYHNDVEYTTGAITQVSIILQELSQ